MKTGCKIGDKQTLKHSRNPQYPNPPAYRRKSSIWSWEGLQQGQEAPCFPASPLSAATKRTSEPKKIDESGSSDKLLMYNLPVSHWNWNHCRFYHDSIVDHKKGSKFIHTKKIFPCVYTT